MIAAKQLQIVQQTNVGLLEHVKEKELNFYTEVYMQIGALAVTISGLMFCSLFQGISLSLALPPHVMAGSIRLPDVLPTESSQLLCTSISQLIVSYHEIDTIQ